MATSAPVMGGKVASGVQTHRRFRRQRVRALSEREGLPFLVEFAEHVKRGQREGFVRHFDCERVDRTNRKGRPDPRVGTGGVGLLFGGVEAARRGCLARLSGDDRAASRPGLTP